MDRVHTHGLPRAQVARYLGSTAETLRLWLKQAAIDAGERAGMNSDEQAELIRMRRLVG